MDALTNIPPIEPSHRVSSPVPFIEVMVQLRRKNSIIKEVPQDYRLLVFRNFDFFCFNQIEEDFNIPSIIVHASNIHYLTLDKDKNKFYLLIKNRGCYSFRVKDQETANFLEFELNKKIKKFKYNFPTSNSVDEKELQIFVSKMLAQNHSNQRSQSTTVSRVMTHQSSAPFLHLTSVSEQNDRLRSRETQSLSPHDYDANPTPMNRSLVSRVFTSQKQRLLELEKLTAAVEKDKLLQSHTWIGMVHHYKMSNLTGGFQIDDDISNYTTPFLAVIFTSRPLNLDYEQIDLQALSRIFENKYWQHLLPSWMEPNTVYLFDAHERLDFRNLVSVFPYSHIIPLWSVKK